MKYEYIVLTQEEHIATLTLNRPDKLNALSPPMRKELLCAFEELSNNQSVRVLIITGAGRGFCAGGDIGYLHELRIEEDTQGFKALLSQVKRLVLAIHELRLPVIAGINGPAAGAGLNLAMACDIRIAAGTATFGAPFTKLGLHPDWGDTILLPRTIGAAKACEMIFTGEMMQADEAFRWGLVNHVVPLKELSRFTYTMAQKIAANSPLAISAAKHAIYEGIGHPISELFQMEEEAQLTCFQSKDALEGISAFLDKRPPLFTGS